MILIKISNILSLKNPFPRKTYSYLCYRIYWCNKVSSGWEEIPHSTHVTLGPNFQCCFLWSDTESWHRRPLLRPMKQWSVGLPLALPTLSNSLQVSVPPPHSLLFLPCLSLLCSASTIGLSVQVCYRSSYWDSRILHFLIAGRENRKDWFMATSD